MTEASYTAWDDKQYVWPPPDGWYLAADQKWWPEGYGPPQPDPEPEPESDARPSSSPDASTESADQVGRVAEDAATAPAPAELIDGWSDVSDRFDPGNGPGGVGVEVGVDLGAGTDRRPPVASSGLVPGRTTPDDGGLSAITDALDGVADRLSASVGPVDGVTGAADASIESAEDGDEVDTAIGLAAAAAGDEFGSVAEPIGGPVGDEPTVGAIDTSAVDFDAGDYRTIDLPDPDAGGFADPMPGPAPEPSAAIGPPGGQAEHGEPDLHGESGLHGEPDLHGESGLQGEPDQHPAPGDYGEYGDPGGQGSAGIGTVPDREAMLGAPPRGPSKGLWFAIFGVIVLVAIGAALFLVLGDEADDGAEADQTVSTGPGSVEQPHPRATGVVVFYPDSGADQRWIVEVLEPARDASEELSIGGDLPADGQQYVATRIRIRNDAGIDGAMVSDLRFNLVDEGAVLVRTDAPCPAAADDLDYAAAVPLGEAVEGTVCWTAPIGELDRLLLGIESSKVEGRVHIRLQ
ncbi:MAG: hypothetical protein AAF547_12745 [Actinomycetota bacterium]